MTVTLRLHCHLHVDFSGQSDFNPSGRKTKQRKRLMANKSSEKGCNEVGIS